MKQIIFFDGVCLLCNGFVDFLLARDHQVLFHFSPLQGERAKELLPVELREELSSVVLWQDGKVFTKSDAVVKILEQLGSLWLPAKLSWVFPRVFRDSVYSLVATRRYAWFGKRESCRMPSPEEKKRFLP